MSARTDPTEPVAASSDAARDLRSERWTFLTNHALVLLHVAHHPEVRIVEIANHAGLSRRAVQMIMHDLVEGGYVRRTRVGRRNTYSVDQSQPMRLLPTRIDQLLALLPRQRAVQ